MNVSPNVSVGINIGLAVLGVVTASSGYFTDMFGGRVSAEIVETAGFSAAILGSVNGALHAFSAPMAGMWAKK